MGPNKGVGRFLFKTVLSPVAPLQLIILQLDIFPELRDGGRCVFKIVIHLVIHPLTFWRLGTLNLEPS